MRGVQGALRLARTAYRCALVNACEPAKRRRCGILSTSYANSRTMAPSQLRCLFAIPIGKSHRRLPRFILVLRTAMPRQLWGVISNSLGLADCVGRAAHNNICPTVSSTGRSSGASWLAYSPHLRFSGFLQVAAQGVHLPPLLPISAAGTRFSDSPFCLSP